MQNNGLALLEDSGLISASSFNSLNPNHFCVLCPVNREHSEEEEIVLALFLKWERPDNIVKFYLSGMATSEEEVNRNTIAIISHAKAYGWEFFRSRNTKEMYMAMMREAMPHLLENANKLSPKDFIKVAKQYDVITGNEVAKQNNTQTFDQRGADQMLSTLQAQLRKAKDPTEQDQILDIFEMECAGIKELWKRHNGLAGNGVTEAEVVNYVKNGKLPPSNEYEDDED